MYLVLVYIGWTMIIKFISELNISQLLYEIAGRLVVPLLIATVTMLLVTNKQKLKLLIHVMVLGASISAFVGIMQYFGVDFFWKLRLLISSSMDSILRMQILGRERITGLAYYNIPLSYQLASVIPLAFAIATAVIQSRKERFYLWISLSIMMLALLFTLTRSAIIGSTIGIILILFLLLRKSRFLKISIVVLLLVITFCQFSFLRSRFSPDESVYAKLPQFIIALKIGINNPIGIGGSSYEQHAEMYFNQVAFSSESSQISEIVLRSTAHNQFLNIFAYYGIPGLVLILSFYVYIFKELNYLNQNIKDPFLKKVNLGLLGSFVSYVIHSMFHNNGPFLSDVFNWYFIGIFLAVTKLHHSSIALFVKRDTV